MFKKINNLSLRTAVAVQSAAVSSENRVRATAGKGFAGAAVATLVMPGAAMAARSGKEQQSVLNFVDSVSGFLLAIFAGVFIAVFVWGAMLIVTSAGNEGRAAKGKKTIMNAMIGLGLVAAMFLLRGLLINVIDSVDGGRGSGGAPKDGGDVRDTLNP